MYKCRNKTVFHKSLIGLIVSAAHVLLLSSEYLELLLYSLSLSIYLSLFLAVRIFTLSNSFRAWHNFENFFVDMGMLQNHARVTFMEWSMMKG